MWEGLFRADGGRRRTPLSDRLRHTGEEREIWIDNLPRSLTEAMIYETEVAGEIEYPLTRTLANRIAGLGTAYRQAKEASNLEGAKTLLLATVWLDDPYFTDALVEKEQNIRPRLLDIVAEASDWNALTRPTGVVTVNALLSLLAQWDVEFSAKHFARLQAQSAFVLLMPWADIPHDDQPIVRKRGMFRFPVARLIDLSFALAQFHKHKKWPDRRPTVKELAIWCAEIEQNLVQWRDCTKSFRWRDFSNIWAALFPESMQNGRTGRVRPLSPLYVAAAIFQDLLVDIDPNSRGKEVGLHDDEYRYWWKIHFDQFQQASGATFGDTPWPAWLTNP